MRRHLSGAFTVTGAELFVAQLAVMPGLFIRSLSRTHWPVEQILGLPAAAHVRDALAATLCTGMPMTLVAVVTLGTDERHGIAAVLIGSFVFGSIAIACGFVLAAFRATATETGGVLVYLAATFAATYALLRAPAPFNLLGAVGICLVCVTVAIRAEQGRRARASLPTSQEDR